MIDIHSHILPGVDDGSPNLEESIRMARIAARSGTSCIVATPHFNIPGEWEDPERIRAAYQELTMELSRQQIPLQLRLGMEIFGTEDAPQRLMDQELWGYEGTQYILIEFDFDENPDTVFYILDEIHDLGYVPIVAHPERYRFVQRDPEMVYEWRMRGYGAQINKGSLMGRFGRGPEETSHALVARSLVTMVASDAHSSRMRTPDMREVWDMLSAEYAPHVAQRLMQDNPAHILRGEPFEPGHPKSFFER